MANDTLQMTSNTAAKDMRLENGERPADRDPLSMGPAGEIDFLLRSFWDATPDLVIVTDTDFAAEGPRILYVNPAVQNALGFEAESLLGRRYSFLQGMVFCATFPEESALYLGRGNGFNCSTLLVNNESEEMLMGTQILPIKGSDGSFGNLIITHRLLPTIESPALVSSESAFENQPGLQLKLSGDQEVQRRSLGHDSLNEFEKNLRHAEELSRNILDSLPSHVAIIDQSGVVVQVNQTWIDHSVRTKPPGRRVVRGVNYLELLDSSDGRFKESSCSFAAGIRGVLEGKIEAYTQESPCYSTGETAWYISRVSKLDRLEQSGAVITHQNISDQKKAEIEKDDALRSAESLSKVAKTLASQLDTEELLRSIIKQVAEVIDFEASSLMILENGIGRILYWEGYPEEVSRSFVDVEFPLDKFKNLKKMYLTGEPNFCADTLDCSDWKILPELTWCRSYIGMPIIARGRVQGFLNLDSKTPNFYKEKDIARLSAFGHLVAVALENAQLYQSLDRYASDLEALINERTSDLRLLNERLETVLDSTSHGIVLINDQYQIRLANSTFARLFGRRMSEVMGGQFVDQFEEENRHAVTQSLAHVQKTKMPIRFDVRSVRPGGSLMELEVNLVAVDKTDGSVVATLHDISHLRDLDRMKDKFIDTISHEFRTPITSIILIADALRKYEDRLTETQRAGKIIQLSEQANLLREMSEAILEFSRIQSGNKVEKYSTVDFANLAQDVVEGIRPRIQDKQQKVIFLHDERESIMVDQGNLDLARIWRNLIENAVKYSPKESGEITIRAGAVTLSEEGITASDVLDLTLLPSLADWPLGRFAVGQVSDNGHGLSESDQGQLFGRFFRGWAQQSEIPGTGLGLAMVKEMLNNAFGDVQVYSVLGEGSSFTFWVPLISEESE